MYAGPSKAALLLPGTLDARRRGQPQHCLHLPDQLDAHHRIGQHRRADQRCPGVQRLLAGAELGDARERLDVRRQHLRPDFDRHAGQRDRPRSRPRPQRLGHVDQRPLQQPDVRDFAAGADDDGRPGRPRFRVVSSHRRLAVGGPGAGATTTTLGLTVGIVGPPRTGVAPMPKHEFPWPAVLVAGAGGAAMLGVIVRRRQHARTPR